jgi:hypothetical protein
MEILRLKATPHNLALQLLIKSAMTTFEDILTPNFHTLEDPVISMNQLLGQYRRFNPMSMYSQEQSGRKTWGLFTRLRLLTVDYKKDRSIKGLNRAAPSTQGFHRGPSGFIITGELYGCLDKHYEKTKQTYLTVDDVAAIQEAPKLEQLSRRRARSLYKLVLGQHGQTGLGYRERDSARRLRVYCTIVRWLTEKKLVVLEGNRCYSCGTHAIDWPAISALAYEPPPQEGPVSSELCYRIWKTMLARQKFKASMTFLKSN